MDRDSARALFVGVLRHAHAGELAAGHAYRGHAASVPDPVLERKFLWIGKAIAILCRVGGWYVPMYGAGRLESHNVKEYEDAADFAVASGHPEFVECLLEMAEVEWEHEAYFRAKVESHWLRHVIPVWPPIPPKDAIRSDFARRNPNLATRDRPALVV